MPLLLTPSAQRSGAAPVGAQGAQEQDGGEFSSEARQKQPYKETETKEGKTGKEGDDFWTGFKDSIERLVFDPSM